MFLVLEQDWVAGPEVEFTYTALARDLKDLLHQCCPWRKHRRAEILEGAFSTIERNEECCAFQSNTAQIFYKASSSYKNLHPRILSGGVKWACTLPTTSLGHRIEDKSRMRQVCGATVNGRTQDRHQ